MKVKHMSPVSDYSVLIKNTFKNSIPRSPLSPVSGSETSSSNSIDTESSMDDENRDRRAESSLPLSYAQAAARKTKIASQTQTPATTTTSDQGQPAQSGGALTDNRTHSRSGAHADPFPLPIAPKRVRFPPSRRGPGSSVAGPSTERPKSPTLDCERPTSPLLEQVRVIRRNQPQSKAAQRYVPAQQVPDWRTVAKPLPKKQGPPKKAAPPTARPQQKPLPAKAAPPKKAVARKQTAEAGPSKLKPFPRSSSSNYCDVPEHPVPRPHATAGTSGTSSNPIDPVDEVTSLLEGIKLDPVPGPPKVPKKKPHPVVSPSKVLEAVNAFKASVEVSNTSETKDALSDGELVDVELTEDEEDISFDEEFEIVDAVTESEHNGTRRKWYKGWRR
ncbi:hypothetical protein BDV96DRAFT_677618 [Lophiotrema nucula]|uniref:Uncharacterized protein n=1 Tax=Lophiotrema nucula TaxID=690887 RepID=A0A6A5ZHW6_9PLEO|nr:hypothetical protein BDV96DRAFT_677618 [Lophiotrema nucula]